MSAHAPHSPPSPRQRWTRLTSVVCALALAAGLAACDGEATPGAAGSGGAPGTGGAGGAQATGGGGGGATTGTGGAGTGGAGTGTGGAGTGGAGAGGSGGGLGQGPLVDRGLLTRYFIDEADAGQGVLELQDAAPDPLPLALTYVPELSFATEGVNRALSWTAAGLDGRASVAVDGTKIAALNGATAATIEVVIDIDAVTTNSSRISHVGYDTEAGRFTLASNSDARLQLRWQGNTLAGEWAVALPAAGRAVVHAVLDTTQPAAEDRARLHVNASPLARVGGAPPTEGQAITLATGRHFVLGNREIGLRSFQGKLYYAAMYAAALTPDEVLHNAAILISRDDTPPPAAPQ